MIKFLIKNSTEVCKNPSADQSTQRYRHRLKTEKLAALLTGAHFAGWLARSRPQVCVCVCVYGCAERVFSPHAAEVRFVFAFYASKAVP